MIKEALEYIIGISAPNFKEIDGEIFSDKRFERISFEPRVKPLELHTLTSFIEYILELKAVDDPYKTAFIHVESPTKVSLLTTLDDRENRQCIAVAEASVPGFTFDRYYEHENFCTMIQARFSDSSDKAILMKFAGTVETGSVATYGDDGVTQKATIKTGIASKSDAIIPNPVMMRPYRTFIEVEQPESPFIFRMRGENSVECALFEADGGKWKNEAMKNIYDYLSEALKDEKITILY